MINERIILSKNSDNVVSGINKANIVKLPIKAPKKSRHNETLLFNIADVVWSSIKSKAKFKKSNKSIYTFIPLTILSI